MASGTAGNTASNPISVPVTFEDVGLGITTNNQPWETDYERKVNANMRAFQTGTMRPFDGIEDPPSRSSKAKIWASERRWKILTLGLVVFAICSAIVWLGVMVHNNAFHPFQNVEDSDTYSTATNIFLADSSTTPATLDIDITVVITQPPAPTIMATATTLVTLSRPPGGFLFPTATLEPSLAPGKRVTWTQTAQKGHCGFDTFTWAVSADGTLTSSTLIGAPSKPTLYDWCKADGDN